MRVPGGLARPVWVDDDDFDLTYHVRQSAVPRPGRWSRLQELVARIITRPLDRSRPLWEMYLIEGLEGGRFAILSKSHQTLVDGISTIDLGQVILDVDTVSRDRVPDDWTPRREPTAAALIGDAVEERLRNPAAACSAPPGPRRRRSARANPLLGNRRAGARVAAERDPVAAAPVPHRAHRASRTTARSAGSTAARSTTWCWPRSPAPSAPG